MRAAILPKLMLQSNLLMARRFCISQTDLLECKPRAGFNGNKSTSASGDYLYWADINFSLFSWVN